MSGPGKIRNEDGMALVTSLMLLVIITILALSMFHGIATQELIAGNTREKERALHAANSAQEYAEWWLLEPSNVAAAPIACAPGATGTPPLATPTSGQICTQTPQQIFGAVTSATSPPKFSWNGAAEAYALPGIVLGSTPSADNTNPPYYDLPGYWITDRGLAADGAGEAYQVDAYGYGSASTTVAVVESVFEVQQGVVNRGGL